MGWMWLDFRSWVRAVGLWWLGIVGPPLDLLAVYGVDVPNLPFGVITSIGLLFILTGSFRAYQKVVQERDVLKPTVDLTIEFEDYPHRGGFGDAKGVVIENLWIVDHTPRPDNQRGILDFEIDLEWQGQIWHFDKHPFQQLYRNAAQRNQEGYFSVPWQIRKNLRGHLVLIERQATLIPDQAMRNFTLRITDVDSGQAFEVTQPGKHRLTWPGVNQPRSTSNGR